MYEKKDASGKKGHSHHIAPWLLSKEMTDNAMQAIERRIHINRSYDIPYLAGYSADGRTIFIDRHMPKSFAYRGRRINTDRFLVVHEAVEKSLIQLLGMRYLYAHQIALHAEQAAVRAEGIEWKAYDAFMQIHIKTIGDERIRKVPETLDLTPYRDFHDNAELRAMEKCFSKVRQVKPKHAVHIAGL